MHEKMVIWETQVKTGRYHLAPVGWLGSQRQVRTHNGQDAGSGPSFAALGTQNGAATVENRSLKRPIPGNVPKSREGIGLHGILLTVQCPYEPKSRSSPDVPQNV